MGAHEVGPAAAVAALGFTALESELYVALLRESPATGYRVAQLVGKPVANTYKGLATLVAKGAAYVDEGGTRAYRATPPEELLARLERDFRERRANASAALEPIGRLDEDIRVYSLGSRDQTLAKAREMLADAKEIVLIAAFPNVLAELSESLRDVAIRGVDVVVKAHAAFEVAGCHVICAAESDLVSASWPGEELHLVVDGTRMLAALLTSDGVRQAIWSASPFLAVTHHSGLATDMCMTELVAGLGRRDRRRDLDEIVRRFRSPIETEGARRLRGGG